MAATSDPGGRAGPDPCDLPRHDAASSASATDGWVPLTSRQQSIWLELKTIGARAGFQVGGYFRTQAAIDPDLFRSAVSDIMRRHDALRLRIDDDEPRQRLDGSLEPPVDFVDLSLESDPEAAFRIFAEGQFDLPMPLDGTPLFRFAVCKMSAPNLCVIFRSHHLIADGISTEIIIRHLAEAYADRGGRWVREVKISPSYLTFVDEDLAYRTAERSQRDLDYWRERFAQIPASLFPARPSIERSMERSRPLLWSIDRCLYDRFLARCGEHDLRPLPVLLGLLAVALVEPGAQSEIVIGLAVPGRSKGQADQVGQFAGIVPLRLPVRATACFADFARSAAEQLGRDYKRQRVPVDALTRTLGLGKHGRRSVFDVFLSYIPAEKSNFDFEFGGLPIEAFPLRSEEANPLALYITEINRSRDPQIEFAYNRAHLDRRQVDAIRDAFAKLLQDFVDNPCERLAEIRIDRSAFVSPIPVAADAAPEPETLGPPLPIRVSATFTAEPVQQPLKFWLRRLGCNPCLEFAGYNQVFQELLDSKSPSRTCPDGLNLILLRVEDWVRGQQSPDTGFLIATVGEFAGALTVAARGAAAPWLVALCPPSPAWDRNGDHAPLQQAAEQALLEACRAIAGVHLVHYDPCRALFPVTDEHDAQGLELGHIPYSEDGYTAIASIIARRAHLLLRRPFKVIAVDCDNTLWGGVLGEDGPFGIRLEDSHLRLQQRLVAAAKSGMLVCLCSKNDAADVDHVLAARTDMLLKPEHIVASRVNWLPKSANLRDIARELNLGLDSFVFLDDNPIEIAEVRASCPEIVAIQVPPNGSGRRFFIEHLWPLDPAPSTTEDAKRTRMYRENAQRTRLERSSLDFAQFIANLGLEIRIEPPQRAQLARLAQLTERTTQFNIHTIRRSAAWFEDAAASPDRAVRAVSVSDKFGDYGLVGIVAGRAVGGVLDVETFLMSCRTLGRGVEHRMLAELGRMTAALGCDSLRFVVEARQRNLPVRAFLETVPGDRSIAGDVHTLVVPGRDAAATEFRPEEHRELVADEPDAAEGPADARFLPAVASEVWHEIAATLDNVPAIEHAVRAANISARGTITPYRAPRNPQELLLARLLADALGVDRVGIDDDFMAMGLQSLAAVQLVSRIRNRAGIELPVRALFTATTIATLAPFMSEGARGGASGLLIPLQLGKPGRAPLFCFHSAIGDAVSYLRLARAFDAAQPVYGLEASGIAKDEPMHATVEEMARTYLEQIRQVQPRGPYYFLGWSFGGALAYEAALQLKSAGEDVAPLVFMDVPTPRFEPDAPDITLEESVQQLSDYLVTLLEEFELKGDKSLASLPIGSVEELVLTSQRLAILPTDFSSEDARRKIEVTRNCNRALRNWIVKPGDFDIIHFRATLHEELFKYQFDWQRHTRGRVETIDLDCTHLRIGFEPYVAMIAERVKGIFETSGNVVSALSGPNSQAA